MHVKWRKTGKFDLVRELIWTLLTGIAGFLYGVIMLLVVTFVFNSIIRLSFDTILLISLLFSLGVMLFRIIRGIVRPEKE
jgi:zinc transporter ZupT